MKYKVYTLIFPRKLSDQEQTILVGEMKSVTEYWQKEMEKVMAKFDRREFNLIRKVPGASGGLDMVKFSLMKKEIHILDYVKLGKDSNDPKKYKLGIATEELSLINNKIKLFGRSFHLVLGNLMDDSALIKHIKEYIIPLIGFKASQISFDVKTEEVDWEKG